MRIGGFQPLSLSDYPEKTCAVIFTQGCPFRCHFCHNPELLPIASTDELKIEDVLCVLEKRKHMLDGVCVTGGEPTIHPDLPQFLQTLKKMGFLVKLDTNGMHPRFLEVILKGGYVDYIAMDIKQTWDQYESIIDIPSKMIVEQIQKSQNMIAQSGIAYEFRTTIWDETHTEEDIMAIAKQLPKNARYALQSVRSIVTLNKNRTFDTHMDLHTLAKQIQNMRPDLKIIVRG